MSLSSRISSLDPAPSHTTCLQSPAVWLSVGVPLATGDVPQV
jgi:hypothetical protein